MLSNTFAQVFVPPIIQYVPPVIPEETFNFSTSDVENTGNEFLEFDGMPLTVMVTDGTNPSISCDLDYGTLKNSFDLGYDQGTPSQEVYDILDPDVAGAIDGSGDAFFIVVYSGYYVPNDQLYLFYEKWSMEYIGTTPTFHQITPPTRIADTPSNNRIYSQNVDVDHLGRVAVVYNHNDRAYLKLDASNIFVPLSAAFDNPANLGINLSTAPSCSLSTDITWLDVSLTSDNTTFIPETRINVIHLADNGSDVVVKIAEDYVAIRDYYINTGPPECIDPTDGFGSELLIETASTPIEFQFPRIASPSPDHINSGHANFEEYAGAYLRKNNSSNLHEIATILGDDAGILKHDNSNNLDGLAYEYTLFCEHTKPAISYNGNSALIMTVWQYYDCSSYIANEEAYNWPPVPTDPEIVELWPTPPAFQWLTGDYILAKQYDHKLQRVYQDYINIVSNPNNALDYSAPSVSGKLSTVNRGRDEIHFSYHNNDNTLPTYKLSQPFAPQLRPSDEESISIVKELDNRFHLTVQNRNFNNIEIQNKSGIKDLNFYLYNAHGQLVQTHINKSNEPYYAIDISDLANGMYILNANGFGYTESFKIVKY